MPRLTKLFVPIRGTHNHSNLAKHGETIFIVNASLGYTQTAQIAQAWAVALATSEPSDFIVPCGPATFNIIGAAMFAARHGTLNLLIYRDGGDYVKRQLDVGSLMALIAEA